MRKNACIHKYTHCVYKIKKFNRTKTRPLKNRTFGMGYESIYKENGAQVENWRKTKTGEKNKNKMLLHLSEYTHG